MSSSLEIFFCLKFNLIFIFLPFLFLFLPDFSVGLPFGLFLGLPLGFGLGLGLLLGGDLDSSPLGLAGGAGGLAGGAGGLAGGIGGLAGGINGYTVGDTRVVRHHAHDDPAELRLGRGRAVDSGHA